MKSIIKADLSGIPSNHYYYALIVILTDLTNYLNEHTRVDGYYFLELRHDVIHHNTSIDLVRLLVRGYIKALLDMEAISQEIHDKYFEQIENYYWDRGNQ